MPPATTSIDAFAALSDRVRKMPSRTSGCDERSSIATNATISAAAPAIRPSVSPGAPAVRPAALTIPYTRSISPPVTVAAPARSNPRRPCTRDSGRTRAASAIVRIPTGRLTKKIQRQDRYSVSTPPSSESERTAADGDRGPDAQRAGALAALGERVRHDRQRGGRHERGAEALQRASADEELGRRRETVEQRREGEERDARDEEVPAAEEVRGAPTEQQEPTEHQCVRVQHPLQRRRREPEVGLDRRQRHVHDRRVEDDHELAQADDEEDEPGGGSAGGVGGPRHRVHCAAPSVLSVGLGVPPSHPTRVKLAVTASCTHHADKSQADIAAAPVTMAAWLRQPPRRPPRPASDRDCASARRRVRARS